MDGAGNSLMVGLMLKGTIRFGSTSFTASERGSDLFVAKVDAAGVTVWSKLLKVGDVGQPIPLIEVDRDGNVLVAGAFKESLAVDDVTLTAGSVATPFVLKFSPSGALLWAQRFLPMAGTGSTLWGLAVDPSGNIAVTGTYKGLAYAFYVSKLAASTGEPLWSRSLEHTRQLGPMDVAMDEAGDVLLVGNFSTPKDGSAPFVLDGAVLNSTGGLADAFVAKLEGGTGRARWSRVVVIGSFLVAPRVKVDRTGNAWVASGVLPASVSLTKFDAAGNVLAGGPLVVGGTGAVIKPLPREWRMALDTSGNLLLGGQGVGPVDFGGGPRTLGDGSGFVAWYDANGRYVADRVFDDAFVGGIATDASGNGVFGGSFSGTVDLGSGPMTSCGPYPFLMKFDPTP
jgi:hypothetical protein